MGLDPPALRHKAIYLFNAAFRVLAIAAHVPFSDRAVRARNRIRAADNADYEIALFQRSGRPWIDNSPKGFVTEHKARLAGRGPAILSFHDLDISSAHSDSYSFYEHGALALIGFWKILQPGAPRSHRFNGNCLHPVTSVN